MGGLGQGRGGTGSGLGEGWGRSQQQQLLVQDVPFFRYLTFPFPLWILDL